MSALSDKTRDRAPIGRRILAVCAIALLACAGWAVWHRFTRARAPDVRTADLGTVIEFMGSPDYSRMYKPARADYARAVLDRVSGTLLEKFYRWPRLAREAALSFVAAEEQALRARHPTRFAEPTPQQLRGSLERSLAHQSPRVQAMRAAFALDLERHREQLATLRRPA
jgi:hypothetical protein